MNPTLFSLTPDIGASIIADPEGGFRLSVFHFPSERELYGFEETMDRAHGWLEGAKLAFAEPEGSA